MTAYTAEADYAELEREYTGGWAPAASLADAHSQWHAMYGATAPCPLDCGAGEVDDMYELPVVQAPARAIRCGHCKGYHPTVDDVRLCSHLQ